MFRENYFKARVDELLSRGEFYKDLNVSQKNASDGAIEWLNDVEIFCSRHLKDHPLQVKLNSMLFHRNLTVYKDVYATLKSISKDEEYISNKINDKVEVERWKTMDMPEYDVFISHANADKDELINDLYSSLDKLGIKIFYDKESLEWGDDWKERILKGTKKSEFAIIVISENFFDREWTEKELIEFLNRQNRNGQKLILPIIHNISMEQLKEKYPNIADIQAIDSSKYNCDEIAIMFAKQLIKRLKSI